jgi:hypothetical protein
MAYRFRVTVHHPVAGFFRFNDEKRLINLSDGIQLAIVPRDGTTLAQATRYHFEGRTFPTEEEARAAGEKLRQTLHVLVGMFGLSLVVPSVDVQGATLAEAEKARIREGGLEVMDSRVGVSVLPDDEKYLEFVPAVIADVTPSDPAYVLKAIEKAWPLGLQFDDLSQRVLETVSFASSAPSPVLKFLTMYLAIEQLLKRIPMSEEAKQAIDGLIETLHKTTLIGTEKEGLLSALGNLKRHQPFSTAFRKFAELNPSLPQIQGVPLQSLVSDSIRLRNDIAHRIQTEPGRAEELARGLRELALLLIWSRNKLPTVTFDRPADTIAIEKFEVRLI